MPVGFGFDLHRLVPGRRFMLGGLEIPFDKGPLGHSDGDVLLHAVVDALLGAAGRGDIGRRFPDSDPRWKGVASDVFLESVMADLAPDWEVVNVDVTVLAEQPKIGPHADRIRERLAARLGTPAVNVKAKTMEGLGPVGAGEAVGCYAVAELRRRTLAHAGGSLA